MRRAERQARLSIEKERESNENKQTLTAKAISDQAAKDTQLHPHRKEKQEEEGFWL